MSKTSRMVALTNPSRFGFEIVDVFFGQIRLRSDQTLAVKGDCLRNKETGVVSVFHYRENNQIVTEEM